jgi:hypothetical protein
MSSILVLKLAVLSSLLRLLTSDLFSANTVANSRTASLGYKMQLHPTCLQDLDLNLLKFIIS